MQTYNVTIGRPGGGSGSFKIPVTAQTPDEARRIAEHQYPGYRAQSVQTVY
jgi:hypothetical protein